MGGHAPSVLRVDHPDGLLDPTGTSIVSTPRWPRRLVVSEYPRSPGAAALAVAVAGPRLHRAQPRRLPAWSRRRGALTALRRAHRGNRPGRTWRLGKQMCSATFSPLTCSASPNCCCALRTPPALPRYTRHELLRRSPGCWRASPLYARTRRRRPPRARESSTRSCAGPIPDHDPRTPRRAVLDDRRPRRARAPSPGR